jgi:hypothetical protein
MPEEARDLHSDLAAAWEAAEAEDSTGEEEARAAPEGEGEGEEAESAAFGDPEAGEGEGEPPEKPAAADESEEAGDGEPEADDPLDTPPRGLTAAQRESWKDTPKAIREAMVKRSEDYSKGIQQYAQAAKNAQVMNQVFQPYQQLFAMTGQSPPQLVSTLLQTAASLHSGSGPAKAKMVADIIQQYGVDVKALDDALVGKAPQAAPQNDPAALVDQRMRAWQEQQQKAYQQQQAQQQQAEINRELHAFATDPKNEFYNDVKGDMADWLEMSSRTQNPALRNMTLEQAYQKACENHPEVSKILEARRSSQQVERKRRANVSVHGTPGGGGDSRPPTDIRGALMHAIDSQGKL